VAAVRSDFDEADVGRCGVQRVGDLLVLCGGKQPVAGEGDDAEPCLCSAERFGEYAAIFGGKVEIVHRAGDIEIGVGVEPIDEGDSLMMEIAFDLEVRPESEGERVAVLQVRPNLFCRAVSER